MISATKDEIARLMGRTRKVGYSEVDEAYLNGSKTKDFGYYDDETNSQSEASRVSRFWKIIGIVALVGFFFLAASTCQTSPQALRTSKSNRSCRFCDQSPPKLHHSKSYTIQRLTSDGSNEEPIVVTPMTVSYDYELMDGEMLFTSSHHELIPNLGYDYAVLGIGSARNVYRGTKTDVSLDEVYVHHFTLQPINMLGAEVLTRDNAEDPYMRLPDGYAVHVTDEENPHLRTNAHLISNKNLLPIDGSMEHAHKECNECYYAPGKGADCTPEVSGTFLCCGDSPSCTTGDQKCTCPTRTTSANGYTQSRPTSTKYTIELDILISRDVHKFQRVDQWNFAAPACSVNLWGESILEDYPSDNYCAKVNLLSKPPTKKPSKDAMPVELEVLSTGDGALFHQVYENNQEPYLQTKVSVLAPTSGTMVWAQSHLHTGGVNATLYKNGVPVCATQAIHGSNEDPATNARNEQNHLVRITSCYDQIQAGIRFDKGDVFTTESYYYAGTDDIRFTNAAGEHKNAMSMFFTAVVLDGDSQFLTKDRTSFNLWNDFVHVAGIHRKDAIQKQNNN